MAMDMSQFFQTFFEESFEGLDVMESGLLNLGPGAADPELINTIFRAAHSIKGGSGTFGFAEIAAFTHLMETLLDQMRSGKRQVDQRCVDALLQSVDVLRDMMTAARDKKGLDMPRVLDFQKQLEQILKEGHGESADVPVATGQEEVTAAGDAGWSMDFIPHSHLLATGNDPVRMFRELSMLGDMTAQVKSGRLPEFSEMNPADCYLGWQLVLHGDIPLDHVKSVFDWVEGDCDLKITPLTRAEESGGKKDELPSNDVATNSVAQASSSPQGADNRSRALVPETNSIRVSIDKIDTLINMVGELVITQSMLGQVGGSEDMDIHRIEKLRNGLAQLERNTRELQESVMRIRMVPISFTFSRFPRLIRDLSQKLGKKAELKLSGEQTELDKTVMEKIGDPLVHLVRNSIDHGIESPQVRKAAGKPETGLIHLDAYHKGGNIVIEISDDGAGLNKEKILAKARAQGLVGDETPPDEQIYELIFHPGLSTAEKVSDVSGRGVGMDVVRRNIKELGGKIDISTELGRGTTLTIRLPLTLAILDGQLIRVGDQTYVIPLVSIIESLQMKREFINSVVGKAELYKLRSDYIPVLRLHDVFSIATTNRRLDGGLLVVAEGDGEHVGVFVDELLGQQQVVIKSLESNYERVEGISGATILGDGTVALILDVSGLIALSKRGAYRYGNPVEMQRAVA